MSETIEKPYWVIEYNDGSETERVGQRDRGLAGMEPFISPEPYGLSISYRDEKDYWVLIPWHRISRVVRIT